MKLDIIIPTYNRAESLRETLQSFLEANLPENLEVLITVVDNNSDDHTKQVVEEEMLKFADIKLRYLFESKQGRSYALNRGIKETDGELLSGIDDDEKIQADWFVEVEKIFSERWDEIDFVGGKILPIWESEPPNWIEPLKNGVICWRDFGDEEWIYSKDTPMITGGHGIFKRKVFEEIGLYQEDVGAKGKGFISGEDEVLYDQLLVSEKRGIYNPKLVIYHFVPEYRLSKNYYRQWLFGVGVSRFLADTHYKPFDGATLFGVPRWMYRESLNQLFNKIRYSIKGFETESLAAENQPLVFLGYFYGRNLQNSPLDKPLQTIVKRLFQSHSR
jgi:glycosyltransferase involved in cell wall biosynthesis